MEAAGGSHGYGAVWCKPHNAQSRVLVRQVLIALLYGTMYWNKGKLPAVSALLHPSVPSREPAS